MKKIVLFMFIAMVLAASCGEKEKKYDVTLIEIKSSTCGACEKMEPVMKKLKEKYEGSDKVNIIVYDTSTPEGSEKASRYNFKRLPTLIFLDKNKREYFRSERRQSAAVISAVIEAKTGKK